jgi:ferric-dicitrate binding protein FerR (iron transport regulator)
MYPVNAYLEIADLIAKHFRGQLTEGEKTALAAWVRASAGNRRLWEQLNNDEDLRDQILSMPDKTAVSTAWQRLQPQLIFERPRPRPVYRVLSYAAVITGMLLGVGLLGYLLLKKERTPATPVAMAPESPAPTIVPGSTKARLILGNGRVVALKDSLEQAFTDTDGTEVKNTAAGLAYTGAHTAEAPVYNILETPRGGEFKVVLPDSSIVWLNASSSLRFPTRFNGNIRNVYLSGEAYFEITKNKSKPFIVTVNNISVTVTGTKFNVKAYPDESYINTTLVEGGVELRAAGTGSAKPVVLRPGYQGIWQHQQLTVQEAYMEEALAWKNGLFVFRSEPLGSIMRKLSRWYDVEISFPDGATTDLRFTGTIRKYESIQKVLDMLALTQKVNFTINQKKISVLKANG